MKSDIANLLQNTAPDHLPPLDLDRAIRRGQRRRTISRAGKALAGLGAVTAAVVVFQVPATQPDEATDRLDIGGHVNVWPSGADTAERATSPPADSPLAAIAALASGEDEPTWATMQRAVLIHADSTQVDLRVQAVTLDDECQWFAVVGHVDQDQLVWRAGDVPPALQACE